MTRILLTGGSGFVGQHLRRRLLDDGHFVVTFDLQRDPVEHPNLVALAGDIRDATALELAFQQYDVEVVLHCAAAVVSHAIRDSEFLHSTNVGGTRNVAQLAARHGVRKVVFISTCCLWRHSLGRPVTELDTPAPGEIYGRSKWEGEKILLDPKNQFSTVVLRSPTVVDSGRLGLFSILFEFIDEGKKIWVVGDGSNHHQFVSATDLVDAIVRAMDPARSGIYNVGSDNVPTLRQAYESVIQEAKTGARVARLPRRTAVLIMRATFRLGISPLGPYQYSMIAEDFLFDTTKIKRDMGWCPTSDNSTMLVEAYRHYRANRSELYSRRDLSEHSQPSPLGVIRVLKWLS
ncbi:MAG: NAD(P)-dependent oxidoreductase [Candidatus Dormibacteraeota bacterium]|nr:NAD(P)-dependent oxidoreductase [Candidatus Dormibacteraeota bacterium]